MINGHKVKAEYVEFYDESLEPSNQVAIKKALKKPDGWKVIIADDEEAVHTMTKMVVQNFQFEGRGLHFLSAYSGEETLRLLKEHPDTAVILLDVVMETENAGLEVAKSIREELENDTVRIILRTGQSGQAPENEVIVNYDINDYKEKTELSVQKLNTMMISSLRTYRDIVRLKESERALLRAKLQAEEANKAKSQFLANMSHELRTPLNGIVVTAQLLKTTELDKEQVEYVEMLLDSTQRLMPIVDDVLDFSKLEAGKMNYHNRRFNLHALVRSIYKSFLPVTEAKALSFELVMADDIPEWLCGDSGKLRQVLTNLISNAIKFTEKGGITLRIRNQDPSEDYVQLYFSVSDTGIGIQSEHLKDIFSAFTQADASDTRNYGGTGLGLAISQAIVKGMHGELGVESTVGEGSRFYFTIAMKPDYCPFVKQEDIPQEAYDEKAMHAHLKGLRVLIADDDLINRKVMESLLVNTGCVVDVTTDGSEVIKKMNALCYDIVLLDVSMPGMDGYETTRQIRSMQEQCEIHTPIIAISAYEKKEVIEKCDQAGMDGFILKPIRSDVLYKMIAMLIA